MGIRSTAISRVFRDQVNPVPTPTKGRIWVALSIWFVAVGLISCVETAECDETILCPDGQTCFELVCEDDCESNMDCGDGEVCTPCVLDDGTGVTDRCFDRGESVCRPAESN